MIGLKRSSPPSVLQGGRVERLLAEAGEAFRTDTRAARQRTFDFDADGLLHEPRVMNALERSSTGRCMFCGGYGQPDLVWHRFRPAQDAVARDGSTSRRHYWWLAYEWNNLYVACDDCHRAQGTKFPIEAEERVRVGTTTNLAHRERPLLVDPFDDDPEAVFVYLDSGEVVAEDRRGEVTIETFDLNRPRLRLQRRSLVEGLRKELRKASRLLETLQFEEFTGRLIDLYSTEEPFAALRRQFSNQWVQFRPRKVESALRYGSDGEVELDSLVGSLRRITNRDKASAAASFFGMPVEAVRAEAVPIREARASAISSVRMEVKAPPEPERFVEYLSAAEIRSIEIRNFRIIEHLKLELTRGTSEGNWLMLLGENGAGKTSILQALALALCDQETLEGLELDMGSLLRHGADECQVKVSLSGSRQVRELRFSRSSREPEVFGLPRQDVLVAGYGSMRLLPGSRTRARQGAPQSRIANLFDPFSSFARPESWLPRLDSDEFDAIARALRQLLRLEPDQEVHRAKSGLQITHGRHRLNLADLSDGYKAMAVFALDMMQLFLRRWGNIDAAEGIVLVDELGAHLHPTWQMRVTESLRATFPRVQFIATTHDPLCLRGLESGEVAVLRRRGDRIRVLHDRLPSVEGLTVDQLLTSEHFGLNSTLDPELEETFSGYYALLSKRRRSAREEEEMRALRNRLSELSLLGDTRRERLALEAIDLFLAEEEWGAPERPLSELREQTKHEVAAIWRER